MKYESIFQRKHMKKNFGVILALLVYMIVLQVTKVYSLIWYLTGWTMPTTGVTRAWMQFLQGNFRAAFEYNAVFLFAPFLALFIYRYFIFKNKIDLRLSIIFALIFLVNNIIRGF